MHQTRIPVKKTILFLLITWGAASATGQVTVLRRQTTAPAPVTYSTSSPEPVPASTYYSDAEDRRAAAVTKVQRRRAGTMEAKGVRPAEYSTTGTAPVRYSTTPDPATTVTVNGLQVQRNVRKGRGQVGNALFTPVSELHYVQFAVYCKDTPVDKAPPIDGLYLLWHPYSTCPGGEQGASYIVKGYNSPEEAKLAVAAYKAARIDCWYNPALTGAEVEIIGVR